MATHDYILANASGAAFRTDLNNALAAIVSNNSNSSSPATTYAYQWWADTSSGILKIRNSANNAWVELLQLDGTLTLEDGSESTPALAFRDDLDTGIFSGGANEFNIATAGSERFVIDSSGNCGIGTSSPTSVLHVQKSGTSQNLFTVESDLGSNNNRTLIIGGPTSDSGTEPFRFTTGNSLSFVIDSTEALRIDSSGKVGIGTSNPSGNLHISSGTSGDCTLIIEADTDNSNESDNPLILFRQDGGQDQSAIGMGLTSNASDNMLTIANSVSSGGITFETGTSTGYTNASERMRIDTSGNVGIGTTSPDSRLHLSFDSGDSQIRLTRSNSASNTNDYGRLLWESTSDVLTGKIAVARESGEDNGYMHFSTASGGTLAERMRIDSSGRLLLGDTSPTTGTSTGHFVSAFNGAAENGIKTRDTSGGGSVNHAVFVSGSTAVGTISGSTSAVSYNNLSDYRVKENDVKISDGITKLKLLRPIRFNFKHVPDTTVDGFFAHEVTPAVPEAVTGEKDAVDSEGKTDPQMLDSSKLVPLLVAAVQELITKVETLEAA